MSLHDGHRKRLKERFLKNGLDSFSEHEILELLLYYCVPRYDLNETAHRLIDQFGSFLQVINAPEKELLKVEGVGQSIAYYIRLLREMNRYLNICEAKSKPQMESPNDCCEYLVNFFMGIHNEVVYLLCLDAKGEVIDCYLVSEGTVNSANISIRKILDVAISCNASSAVLAHNHPGGFAVPSKEDRYTTMRIAKALYLADIILTDHIIVAGKDYISMAVSGLYDSADICIDD